ncbi:MAG: L,D-transpeptidase family protein [Pseudomonadota bacterium]|nr:hypothetical protein [Gammaproteobacteria bacterium]MEE2684364.1 L,D-transpeptidase family protein [Pseudomonadota bacterium]|tara:strand:+ start:1729 stop:2250 length:522 start_codon:yes stop_codon:yes gene_type:complete
MYISYYYLRNLFLTLFIFIYSIEAVAESMPIIPKADYILVIKSERKLILYSQDTVIKEFDISLGLAPKGAKIREGDFRTPEGRYYIESKNPDSNYFLSLKISYPNEKEASFAIKNGYSPGGLIMIHGQPNNSEFIENEVKNWDWTDGCIAVSNSDMRYIWESVNEFIPIEIRP